MVKRIRYIDASITLDAEAQLFGDKRAEATNLANTSKQQLRAAQQKLHDGVASRLPTWVTERLKHDVDRLGHAKDKAVAAQEKAERDHRFAIERSRSFRRIRAQAENVYFGV